MAGRRLSASPMAVALQLLIGQLQKDAPSDWLCASLLRVGGVSSRLRRLIFQLLRPGTSRAAWLAPWVGRRAGPGAARAMRSARTNPQ